MLATSPPGSTMAARLVAVQATIEQFCWIGVTGTSVPLSGCIHASRLWGTQPINMETHVLRQRLHELFRRGALALDHIIRPVRAELGSRVLCLVPGSAHHA